MVAGSEYRLRFVRRQRVIYALVGDQLGRPRPPLRRELALGLEAVVGAVELKHVKVVLRLIAKPYVDRVGRFAGIAVLSGACRAIPPRDRRVLDVEVPRTHTKEVAILP